MKFLIVSDSQVTEVGHATKWSAYVRHRDTSEFFNSTVEDFHVPAQLTHGSNANYTEQKVKVRVLYEIPRHLLPRFCVPHSGPIASLEEKLSMVSLWMNVL